MIGDIMSILRLRMGTDGEGISTLVAFFDCPLHCRYCANFFCHDNLEINCEIVPRASYTPEELVMVLKKDEAYYRMTGGGIVFGGGEPLLQSDFIHAVCAIANPKWKKRIETSLNVPWRNVEPVLHDFDEWIIDIKTMDSDIYKRYTGIPNYNMLENLNRIKDYVSTEKLHIRVPNIPNFTREEDMKRSVKLIKDIFPTIEPEVFDYFVLSRTWASKWGD